MTNLLSETWGIMKKHGKKPEDIIFIGSENSGHSCSWREFERLADREYNAGYGSTQVATDLIIIFKDNSRMNRAEYDGCEWWNFQEPFKMPLEQKPISNLFVGLWESLAECQEKEKENA